MVNAETDILDNCKRQVEATYSTLLGNLCLASGTIHEDARSLFTLILKADVPSVAGLAVMLSAAGWEEYLSTLSEDVQEVFYESCETPEISVCSIMASDLC